jgi:hypothetical protein
MHKNLSLIRWSFAFCLSAAVWFALGGAIKVFAAASNGRTVAIVVCSGAGMTKIYVQIPGAEQPNHEASLKHCGSTPLALATVPWNVLDHLAYAAPSQTPNWQATDGSRAVRNWVDNGRPPPGRAPPAFI